MEAEEAGEVAGVYVRSRMISSSKGGSREVERIWTS